MNEKATKEERGGRRRKKGGGRLERAAGTLLLGVAVALVLALLALVALERQKSAEMAAENGRLAAAGVAARLGDDMRLRVAILDRYVREERLGRLLKKEKWKLIEQRTRRFKRLVPDVIRLRVLPKEWEEMDPGAEPPFGFAALEVLRTVERSGKPSVVEVHQLGKPFQHLVLAVPVRDDAGALVGVAHLALSFDVLRRVFRDTGIQLQLRQQVPGRAAVAVTGGPGDDTAPTGVIPVPGTLWQVAYWPGPAGDLLSSLVAPVAVLGAVLLAIVMMVLLFIRWLRRLLADEQRVILSQVKGLLKDEARGFAGLAVAELDPLMRGLAELQKQRAGGTVPVVPRNGNQDPVRPPEPEPASAVAPPSSASAPATNTLPPAEIFRAYDIRGVVGEQLTEEGVERIGRAIGSQVREQDESSVVVGRDGRNSSDALAAALCRGLTASGCDVVDLGLVPTPLVYFATQTIGIRSGVMVTGSHNPPEYNGLKVVIGGDSLSGDAILGLRQRIEQGRLREGQGRIEQRDLLADYLNRITEDVQLLAPMKIVLDCGNGAGGLVAPLLFRALGCEVTELYCEVNGNFPAHHPDPSDPDNLAALIAKVEETGADLGIALDGDADRLGVVDGNGKIIWPDRLLMLLARDVLSRNPGADVIYDVKSGRHLAGEILAYGGRPIMWKSGHSLMKAKLRETGAMLAGELSGHIFFGERWYGFDDGLYSSARLLEVLSAEGLSPAETFAQLPESVATPEIHMPVAEGSAEGIVERLREQGVFPGAKLVTIDGIRAEFGDGWGLVRASHTTPSLVFRFEADDESVLERIQQLFREQLATVDPTLTPPF